jgi:hypothetical protein
MKFPKDYFILTNDEIRKNNGEIIEYRFYQYFHTKDTGYIYDFIKFIKDNAFPSWKDVAASKDRESQIILFLLSCYTMALFSFLINIKNDAQAKKIINDSEILDENIKSYIIKRFYLYIMSDSVNILENWYTKNEQIKKKLRDKYTYYGKAILWGFKDRLKKFKSSIKVRGLAKRFILLNKDVIYFLHCIGVYGHKYKEITRKINFYSIRGDDWFVDITFKKMRKVAEVSWGTGLGALSGSGSTKEFIKENNRWRKICEHSHWIS